MIQYLKKAFELVVHEQPWLPESFKHELVEKVITFFSFTYLIIIHCQIKHNIWRFIDILERDHPKVTQQ